MNDATNKNEAAERQGWYAWWSSKTGTWVALGILVAVCAAVIFGNLAGLGIWEPWEADEIIVAREYAQRTDEQADQAKQTDQAADTPVSKTTKADDGYQPNWATPTLDGKPVAEPLLKTWLISWSVGKAGADGDFEVGKLERSARMPTAVAIFLLVLLAFFWIKSHFDTWSALLTCVAFATTPAIFLGVHTLSTEMLFVALSSLSIMAFFQLSRAHKSKERWLWGLLLGLGLSLSFLEHRFFGLLSPMAVIVGYALTQLPFEQVDRARRAPSGVSAMVDRVDIGLCVAALLGAGGVLLWGVKRSSGSAGDAYFLPHVLQWIAVLVPSLVLLAGLMLARKTRAAKSLLSGPGALAAVMVAVTAGVLVSAYGAANPVHKLDGEIVGKMPLFSYLLENRLSGNSPAAHHMHFAMWVREIGFSLMPWVGLVPLGVGYLARAARLQDDDGNPIEGLTSARASMKRLFLVWAFVAAVVVALASGFDHFYYPAYLPLLAGVGLMLADADFFKEARLHSLLAYAMGFVAVATVMMLGKDLHRFPDRFMEPYLAMQEDLELPDAYTFGKTMKALKYAWALLLATYFFGLVSWAGLTLRNMRQWPEKWRAWRERRKNKDAGAGAEPDSAGQHAEQGPSPMQQRATEKEAYRHESGLLPALARLVELPSTWAAIVAVAGVATAVLFLYDFAPQQSAFLSQRGIFESYTKIAKDGQKLYRYNVSVGDSSVYLGDVPQISRNDAFVNRFDDDERYFVVIPRKRLASINYDIRRRFGRDLPVLDASSSRLLLASNKLDDGEEQKNFIAQSLVENPDDFEPEIPTLFAEQGQIKPATFDDNVELIGWDIDHKPDDGSFPSYEWGETAKLTFYFRVKKRISGQYKIFMHVDYPGSRIHGDHDPVHGDFPTNYWLPGDIVKDEYDLHIDSYSAPGVYTIWLGFFRGNDRMKVSPKQANDGDDRAMVGKIRVEGML